HFHDDGTIDERDRSSRDDSSFYKANVWASGPIMKDRLFFFAMYEKRDSDSQDIDTIEAWKTSSNNDFWGAKLDWQLNDNHLVDLLVFSDKADSLTAAYDYAWDSAQFGPETGECSAGSGGDNWSLAYTGHVPENFMAKAMHGVNK